MKMFALQQLTLDLRQWMFQTLVLSRMLFSCHVVAPSKRMICNSGWRLPQRPHADARLMQVWPRRRDWPRFPGSDKDIISGLLVVPCLSCVLGWLLRAHPSSLIGSALAVPARKALHLGGHRRARHDSIAQLDDEDREARAAGHRVGHSHALVVGGCCRADSSPIGRSSVYSLILDLWRCLQRCGAFSSCEGIIGMWVLPASVRHIRATVVFDSVWFMNPLVFETHPATLVKQNNCGYCYYLYWLLFSFEISSVFVLNPLFCDRVACATSLVGKTKRTRILKFWRESGDSLLQSVINNVTTVCIKTLTNNVKDRTSPWTRGPHLPWSLRCPCDLPPALSLAIVGPRTRHPCTVGSLPV